MNAKLLVFFLLCVGVSTFAQTKDENSLNSLVKQMTEAQINFQPEVLDKILTSDYIEISPLGEFDPRAKVLGFYQPQLKPPAGKMSVELTLNEVSIRSYKDFAIVIARLDYNMISDGKSLPPRSIRATYACRREKGVWKIASAQYTGIRPPQP